MENRADQGMVPIGGHARSAPASSTTRPGLVTMSLTGLLDDEQRLLLILPTTVSWSSSARRDLPLVSELYRTVTVTQWPRNIRNSGRPTAAGRAPQWPANVQPVTPYDVTLRGYRISSSAGPVIRGREYPGKRL